MNNNNNNNEANISNKTLRNRRRRQRRNKLIKLGRQVQARALRPMNRKPYRNLRQIRRFRMPVAETASVPKIFYTRRITGTSAVVAGCDLAYSIPNDIQNATGSNVITMIPANPAYWTGTRIAQVAAGYQNYRPIQFEVIYVPQCAVTQQGNVIAGTLWNEVPTEQNMQQTLKTSNGGMLTQCYRSATSIVRMKSNLQYNLYRMGGPIDQESNPFIYIALAIACKSGNNFIIPGYFYIRYTYVLKNPIGTGINYQNSQLVSRSNKNTYLLNASVYLCNSVTTQNALQIPTGSRLDVEYDYNNNQPRYLYYYNGTLLDTNSITNIWVLENQPNIPSNQASLRVLKEPTKIDYVSEFITQTAQQKVEIPSGEAISFRNIDVDYFKTIINNTLATIQVPIFSPGTKVYRIADLTQNFGEIQEISTTGYIFYAIQAAWTYFQKQMVKKERTQSLDKISVSFISDKEDEEHDKQQ